MGFAQNHRGAHSTRPLRFYVNTREQPPQSSWVHPLGPPGPPGGYSSPPYSQGYQSPGNYNNGPPGGYAGGYQQAPPPGRGIESGAIYVSCKLTLLHPP